VAARLAQAPHVLLYLDYDGTLAPIVSDPAKACLSAPMAVTLRALGACELMSVTIISGRERADLQARVGVPGLIYAGNHGLEISGPGFVFIEPAAVACEEALQRLAADLTVRLRPIAGAFVEDKGLTVSVHFRQAPPEARDAIRHIVEAALAD